MIAEQVLSGDRRCLAQAITLVESTRPEDREAADTLLDSLIPHSGKSIRIGISGVPGVGKSTFIEALGNHIVDQGHRVAVLAVDPSSAVSGGSILGDKTRMEQLSQRPEAYIRPSPTGGALGGVTRRTRDTLLVVEAAGFDVVIIETVGVGQSEIAVAEMTDIFVLLLLPGAGDELQGIKRGIVELADLILVNKADGANVSSSELAAADYRSALQFLSPRSANWEVPVMLCSATECTGIAEVWNTIEQYQQALTDNGEIASARASQAQSWLWTETANNLMDKLRNDPSIQQKITELEQAVTEGRTSPRVAARKLVEDFSK